MKKLRFVSAVLAALFCVIAFAGCKSNKILNNFSKYSEYDSSAERYNYNLLEYINVADYLNIEVPTIVYTPTERDIEKAIYNDRTYFTTPGENVTDRPVCETDAVVINYSCTVNGESYSAIGKTKDTYFVGTEMYDIPEFDQSLIGMNIGETKTFDFTFPDPYYMDIVKSGQQGSLTITLVSIEDAGPNLPEVTDEFAEHFGYATVEAYRNGIITNLKIEYNKYLADYAEDIAWQYVVDNTTVTKYPELEYLEVLDASNAYYESYAKEKDMTLEEYAATLGYTLNEFRTRMEDAAYMTEKNEMILYVIARCENIQLTQQEYESAAWEYAEEMQLSEFSDVERFVDTYVGIENFKEQLRFENVRTFLGENVKKTDKTTVK